MNVEAIRSNLEAQGLSSIIIESMIKSMQKASEPAKKKTAKRWFPGMDSKPSKIETDVEVTSTCLCCGTTTVKMVKMTIKEDSPRTQKINTSLCSDCPAVLREYSKEELLTAFIIKCHPSPDFFDVLPQRALKMAKKFRPEDVICYTKGGETNETA
jgi:hypothetical protein